MSVTVYIGAGSNMGDRFRSLKEAWTSVRGIFGNPDFSSLWETAPLIVENQPKFLNMVFSGQFRGSSRELLDSLQKIEAENGRDRRKEVFKGPRALDLDILLFGDESANTEVLALPHPGIQSRSFVLTPLLELYPAEGRLAESFRKSLSNLGEQEIVCRRNRSEPFFWESGEPDGR